MAHSLSAKKRVRQNLRRNARNRSRKDALKGQMKAFTAALAGGDAAKSETELNNVVRKLDRMAVKGAIHKNTASRRRSRLAKRINALKAAPKGTKAA